MTGAVDHAVADDGLAIDGEGSGCVGCQDLGVGESGGHGGGGGDGGVGGVCRDRYVLEKVDLIDWAT